MNRYLEPFYLRPFMPARYWNLSYISKLTAESKKLEDTFYLWDFGY